MSRFNRERKFRVTCVLGTIAAVGLLAAMDSKALDLGDPAPTFKASALVGNRSVSLESHRGKVVYLDFWASWCPPCLTSLPLLEDLRKEFAGDDFQILAVNLDRDPAKARRLIERIGIGYPSAHDPLGALPEAYGVETMPTSFLIDRSGNVRWIHGGFRSGDVDLLRERIKSLIGRGE